MLKMPKKIPRQYRDLRRHVLYTDLKKLIFFGLWMIGMLAGALYYNYNHQTYPPERRIVGWKMVIWIAVCALIGFFLFRLWTFFTDRSYAGTIQYSGLVHTYTPPDDPYAIKSMSYDYRIKTNLVVALDNKKKRRVRFEQKIGSYWYYNEGEKIIRFHGCPYPLNLDPDAPHGYVCVACGRMHKSYQPECEACFLALIDPKEVLREARW